jgi:hypothetical protein
MTLGCIKVYLQDPIRGRRAVWSSAPGHWSLRSTIGQAAKLTVEEGQRGGPRFRKWQPFVGGTTTGELFQLAPLPTSPATS